MQAAADASALGGVSAFRNESVDVSTAESTALAVLDANKGQLDGLVSKVVVDGSVKTVEVQLSKPGARTFSALALSDDPTIRVTSKARMATSGGAPLQRSGLCVLALDPAMDKALLASGGGLVWAKDCWVQVNSSSSKAVNFSGNSVLTSGTNCFVGGVDQGLALMTPSPEAYCQPMADPFALYSKPAVGGCDHNSFTVSGGSPVLSPGVYCGGLRLSSVTKATLQPGLYVIKDGLFTMSGGGILEGNGVTLFLTGTNAGLNWSGGGGYHLVAPRAGEPGIPGFVVFLDPVGAAAKKTVISGTGQMYYEGILYFPTQQVEVSGTGLTESLASPYTIYIANNFLYSGGSQMVVRADKTQTDVYIPPEVGGAAVVVGGPVLIK